MLSLQVREGDYILVGDNIRITVQKGIGANMKLGFEAPRSISIVRGKVYEQELMKAPYENIEELEANRMKKEDFKKDAERYGRKRDNMIAKHRNEELRRA